MAKSVKTKHRGMKRTLRKTLGALFLASAILVAAIPAEGLQAGVESQAAPKVTVDIMTCNIPHVSESETIYTTGDGQYQFAYVSPKNASSNNKVAVILGYNGGYLVNGALNIPDTVDAYLKYSDSMGTTSGYVAVGKKGNFLFYEVKEPVLDANGNPIYDKVPVEKDEDDEEQEGEGGSDETLDEPEYEEVLRTNTVYYPCYYEDHDKWKNLSVEEFFYEKDNQGTIVYAPTITSEVQRIQGAEVWYIGNQYLVAGTGDDAGTWKIAGDITDSSKGIFSGQGNIRTLTVGERLSGIGNYAFYGCSGMSSIKLGNGLDTIGNYAFANCINMTTVELDFYSRVDIIGDHAFFNCQALKSFNVPISVRSIGDSAFEECYSAEHIELCGGGANVSLTTLGPRVFKNCANLKSITFPRTFTNNGEVINVSMFEGCTSLQYISTSNNLIRFTAGDDENNATKVAEGFKAFKDSLPDEFYFEGLPNSPVHTMSTEHNFAFSHLNKNLYEITIVDKDDPSIKAVYRVNSSNQLVYTSIPDNMAEIDLPKTIGPYKIQVIDSGTFQNRYGLEKIVIPSSITSIEADAFKGCYNLKNVIFTEPINITYIGEDAFKTQDVSKRDDVTGLLPTLPEEAELSFTGVISFDSEPFRYAMDPESNINVGNQQRSYITFYSGWPTNLEVRYNPDTDKNELVDYPTFRNLKYGTKYTVDNYAYMTAEYTKAAKSAFEKYTTDQRDKMTDDEKDIIDAALNIVLPSGIESIQAGLFSRNEGGDNKDELGESNSVEKTITAYSLMEVAGGAYNDRGEITGGAFEDCINLKAVYLIGGTRSIGDYAFEGCNKLTEVYLPTTVEEMGVRPFVGCGLLNYVDFQGSPYFTCKNSIIYQLDMEGNPFRIIQYLEGREAGVVEADELIGVKEISPEAFMDTNVSSVDMRKSSVEDITELAFGGTGKLFSVYLPYGCLSVSKDAFKNSTLQYLELPSSVNYIDAEAFNGVLKDDLTFYCEDGSNAKLYADKNGIKTTTKPAEVYYTVTFWDYDATLLDTQKVGAGMDAVPPEVPGREGYVHTGWVPSYRGVQSDLQITAQYEAEDPDAKKFTVKFVDYDDSVLKTTLVLPGGDAEPPLDPKREGYTFTGWRPSITNIQDHTTVYAQYEKLDSTESQLVVRFIDHDDTVLYTQKVNYGEDAILPQSPTREGYVFTGWRPSVTGVTKDMDVYAMYEKAGAGGTGGIGGTGGAGGAGGTGSGNGTGQTTTKLYTLTVRNGSGSGSYAAGSQPIVIANDPASGMEFDYWSIDPTETKIASKVLTATVITMPEGDVTVTAHYKVKSSVNTGSGNYPGYNSNRPNNSQGSITSEGTTVVIDKNGLSNTGVVSATVNGSSDNFTIKVTESEAAAEAALRALMAEYGDDLSGIKYFPMDITLYDSKGTKKITDTSGLSIKITLPLPDSMINYAGNNKVAGIVNNKLDKLNARFNTISGVPCITFTAEHFSPYVIYVDTNNLTAGIVNDDTPKTGDGIHPKWFLSLGLACISVVLFMKKDKRVIQKVTV